MKIKGGLVLMLVIVLVASLAGCGEKVSPEGTSETPVVSSQVAETPSEEPMVYADADEFWAEGKTEFDVNGYLAKLGYVYSRYDTFKTSFSHPDWPDAVFGFGFSGPSVEVSLVAKDGSIHYWFVNPQISDPATADWIPITNWAGKGCRRAIETMIVAAQNLLGSDVENPFKGAPEGEIFHWKYPDMETALSDARAHKAVEREQYRVK
jgi:hypothetical protein